VKQPAEGEGKITITSPQPEQWLQFSEAGLSVSVSVTPALQNGQKVVIYLDGSEVASGTGSSFTVKNVYRGAHTLSAAVVSAGGATLFSSESVTFYIRQPSIIKR
jgi:hypothetical protein